MVGMLTRTTYMYMSYLDIAIGICGGRYTTNLYDKKDNFGFDIVHFPFMSSNIFNSNWQNL